MPGPIKAILLMQADPSHSKTGQESQPAKALGNLWTNGV